ncbi:SIMPL domain-containing protein [Alkalibacillus aidingensis]|uniref:SIMPL domain-containing protein n=1 Tax=Alkalibacillus aidingensis TaxID=2747607 RepID=UPI001660AAE1|nr:SIMPL domain-containing protein [Alkalibacillus aidingensis]
MYYSPYSPLPYHVTSQVQPDEKRVMTVVGEGIVTVEPNVAEVRLGVVSQDESLTHAQSENSELINQVMVSIQGLGIPREKIQTVDYSIRPRYDYVDGVQQFRGYEVSHSLQVTIDEISQAGRVIDVAVQSGANRVWSVELVYRNQQNVYQSALRKALESAVAKAVTLANAMGASLDSTPIKIDEQVDEQPITYQAFTEVESPGTTIEPGQLVISARVEAQFQYIS